MAALTVGSLVGGLFLLALRYPHVVGIAESQSNGPTGWAGLAALTAQISAAAGLVLFCWIAVWLSVKEFRGKPDPERSRSRWTIVAAILFVSLRWSVFLVAETALIGLAFGALVYLGYISPKGSQPGLHS